MMATLDIQARVVASLDGNDIQVIADGSSVLVNFPGWQAVRSIRSFIPQGQRSRLLLQDVQHVLRATDLRLHFAIRGRKVGQMGAAVRPGLISRWLGLAPVSVRPLALFVSWLGL